MNLPKLDGKNFQSWFELISIALELKGLKKAIEENEADDRTNLQAKFILLESMDESHRAQVRGCHLPKEIVDRLKLIYADKSAANIYRLLMQYYRYVKNPSDSMSEHIGRMDEMRNQLADLKEQQSDAVYQITLIGSLPHHGSLGADASRYANNSKSCSPTAKTRRRFEENEWRECRVVCKGLANKTDDSRRNRSEKESHKLRNLQTSRPLGS